MEIYSTIYHYSHYAIVLFDNTIVTFQKIVVIWNSDQNSRKT